MFKNDVPRALNILSDMLTAPKLDSSLIERERGVILREMEEVNQQQVSFFFFFRFKYSFFLIQLN